jgi:hypothetical protein
MGMSQQSEVVLNNVLIDMARSFLQYVAESWPWVDAQVQSIEQQVIVVAARQRQDVAEIVTLLTSREHFIDFGSFPTEYTDLQFIALDALFDGLNRSQASVLHSLATAIVDARATGDNEAADLLTAIRIRQQDAATALQELQRQLTESMVAV